MAWDTSGAKKGSSSYEDEGKMQVRVSDFAHGVRIYDGVRLVRIKSRDYTLLIMEDYFPLLGDVEGLVELVQTDEQVSLGRVKGYYMLRDNEFSLLIETQLEEPSEVEDEREDS